MKLIKKVLPILLLCACLAPSIRTEAAGTAGWKRDHIGWWYQNADGTWPANTWSHINNKWYYFNSSGYMLSSTWISSKYYVGADGDMLVNTTTPDGYRVGSDGAWIDTGTQEPTPPSKSVTDKIKTHAYGDYQRYVSYNGKRYDGYTLHVQASYNEGATIEDKGTYYIVHNATIQIILDPTDFFTIYRGSVYIRKNAKVHANEVVTTAEQTYNKNGSLSNREPLGILEVGFDAQGYIVEYNGAGAS